MNKYVIKQHRPVHLVLVVIILCVITSVSLWLYMDKSHWQYIKSRMESSEEDKRLWEINQELIIENKKLNERLNKTESIAKVDKQTIINMQEDIINLQNEVFNLKGELEFYKGIMDASRQSGGLNIQGLFIEKHSQENNYGYNLILTHVSKSNKTVEGQAEIFVEGIQDNITKVYNIKEISQITPEKLNYKFKHFKRLTGNFMLPNGFNPYTVLVKLYPNGDKLTNIEKVFDWSDATY